MRSRLHGFGAQSGHRDRELGGLVLDGVEPMRVRPRLLQQPVARAQRPLERVDPAGMLGVDRERQAIEKAPALGRRADEQRIHRRHQPDHAQMIGKRRGRRDRLAIDAVFALDGGAVVRRRVRCRCRAWRARARLRPRRRPPRSRRPRGRRLPRAWRGAGRGRARETKSPRSDWSCRRRSARPAQRCRHRLRATPSR